MSELVSSVPTSASFLTVGATLKITLTVEGEKLVYGSTLLGWKDHAWLLCEWPAQVGHERVIPHGTPCTVSYLRGGKLIGYRCEIREMTDVPVPLLLISFPHAVEEVPLRKHVRVASNEPMLLLQADGQAPVSRGNRGVGSLGALLKDLSLGGCSVALVQRPAWIRPGARLRMEFSLPGLGHVTNLAGTVKTVECQDGTEVVGVQFHFNETEFIEYRGWGGSVQQAIEQCVMQKLPHNIPPAL